MTDNGSVAGKWGPIAFAVDPLVSLGDLEFAASDLKETSDSIKKRAQEKMRQARLAGDEQLKETLWAEHEDLCCEAAILSAWHHLVIAVCTFVCLGCQSRYMGSVTDIGVVDMPQPYQG